MRRSSRLPLLVASALLASASLSSRGAAAQVNAEALRTNPLKPGFSVNFDGSFALATGNVELFDLQSTGRVQYQTLYPVPPVPEGETPPLPFIRQRVLMTGSGRFTEANDKPVASQSYLHMRWTGMWHPRVGTDVFIQHQYDRFFRLQRRSLAGAGIRVDIVHEPTFLWWGGSAYMLEYERINVKQGAPDEPETLSHRWTNYLTERLALGDSVLLQSTTYFQPRFDDFSDYRVLEVLEGLGKVSDLLGFGLSLTVLHDSAPPTGVKNTDVRLTTNVHLAL
ncbi:MAG: DUF481 domain-containing protein [Polyangiaceae bacterium]